MPGPRLGQFYQHLSGWGTEIAIIKHSQVVLKHSQESHALPAGSPDDCCQGEWQHSVATPSKGFVF